MEEFIVGVLVISCFVGLYMYGVWFESKEDIVKDDRVNKSYSLEELMVVTNYDLTDEEVAIQLGRTVNGIRAKRWSINKKNNEGVTNE